MDANEAYKVARLAVMEKIEKKSRSTRPACGATSSRSSAAPSIILYRYKKYTDVRLVWAPRGRRGHFGGDPDNFEYPRYCLDVALVRAYENGKPVEIEHFLKWSKAGASGR